IVPNDKPPTASATTAAPSQSKRLEALLSRLSLTYVTTAHRATTQSGTLIRKAARQDSVSTSVPPTNGPRIVVAVDAAAHRPKARPCASPLTVTVRRASAPGTSRAPAAPCSTRH